ncbi:hypothetical protein ANN_18564 [Periplaneta americana]|uniref:Uncharacterized protein n=1 Tax=Periplaneta americana TaxID=6978 RepID=A0ABQ8SP40_PERAM|nr:hypothetical protein ANN_18564 [Periplaneta americana]
MSPGSSTESYPAFARIGLRENPGKNLNQAHDKDNKYHDNDKDHDNDRVKNYAVSVKCVVSVKKYVVSVKCAVKDHDKDHDTNYDKRDDKNYDKHHDKDRNINNRAFLEENLNASPVEIHRQLEVYSAKWRFQWQVLDHSPHSSDLVHSDFHLFGPLKKHLCGNRFNTDMAVRQAVMTWLQGLDADFFYAGIGALVYSWNKCRQLID